MEGEKEGGGREERDRRKEGGRERERDKRGGEGGEGEREEDRREREEMRTACCTSSTDYSLDVCTCTLTMGGLLVTARWAYMTYAM